MPNDWTKESLLKGRLSTVDLRIMMACFVKEKKVFFVLKAGSS